MEEPMSIPWQTLVPFLIGAAILSSVPLSSNGEDDSGKILFRFEMQPEAVATLANGDSALGDLGPDGGKSLTWKPEKAARIFKKDIEAPEGAEAWKNCEVEFKARRTGEGIFGIAFPHFSLNIYPNSTVSGSNGLLLGSSSLKVPSADGWNHFVVRLFGSYVQAFLVENGQQRLICEDRFKDPAAIKFNFTANKPGEYFIADLVVRELKTPPPSEDFKEENGAKIALRPASVSVPLDESFDALGMTIVPGLNPPARISVEFGDGKKRVITLNNRSQKGKHPPPTLSDLYTQAIKGLEAKAAQKPSKDAKTPPAEVDLEDSLVNLSGTNVNIYARPNLVRYTDEQQDELIRKWNELTPASKKPIYFEFRSDPAGVVMWINGCYAGILPNMSGLRVVTVGLPSGGSIKGPTAFKLPETGPKMLALDISKIAKPGVMENASVSIPEGFQRVEGLPMLVASGKGNGDVGVVKEMKGSWALECDEHLSRIAFDGMPSTLHFSIPKAFYSKAYVLCAVEPDPKKDPVLTARLTRFASSGRGDAIANCSITLPRGDEAVPGNIKIVGKVQYDTGEGKIEVPLYLAEIPLRFGEILDLLNMDKDPRSRFLDGCFLDFEFLGKIAGKGFKPDRNSTSAVHVFGVTLEKSPCDISFVQSQPGNIFHNDETPETSAVLKSNEKCELSLSWKIRDVKGNIIKKDSAAVSFSAPGEERKISIPLSMPKLGWYGLDFELTSGKKTLMTHDAAFALLGKDMRKAGYESPYGIWWFGGAHYGCDDLNIIGPMLFKAGFRRTTFGWTKSTEADYAKWKVTLNQISWGAVKLEDLPGSEKKVAELLEKFPHCNSALIFHESFRSYVPAELFGQKQEESAEEIEKAKKRVETATKIAQFYREKFPQIKLVWGNSGCTASLVAMLLRHGLDPKYIDYFGLETSAGQTAMPEKLSELTPQSSYLIKETARKFGVEKPVTGCYEFTCRCERNLGAEKHAQFYVRDILVSLAYNYQHISPGLLYDAGNAYFNTLWGGSGICRRAPLFYPRPAYVAMAALTNALDQVKLRRRMPTGSATVYGLEFERADGRTAYALWTPKAGAELGLEFPDDAKLELFEFYGERSEPKLSGGKFSLLVGPSPRYLISTYPAKSANVLKQITEKLPEGFSVANKIDDASAWSLCNDYGLTKESGELPLHVLGKFSMRQADDPERGKCIELELHGNDSLPDLIGEYCAMRLAKPAPLPGEPHSLGVWVKGNSSWGKIVFEFMDAEGKLWRSHGGEWHDWPGELSINFDGWHFVSFPIDEKSPIIYSSPGGRMQSDAGRKQGVAYPISITKLYVILNRKALDLNEMKPVSPIIRLSNVGAF